MAGAFLKGKNMAVGAVADHILARARRPARSIYPRTVLSDIDASRAAP